MLGPFQTELLYFIIFDFIFINYSFEKAKNGALFKRALDAVQNDESVHSSIVGLSCPTPPTERGIMRVPHTM